MKRISVLCALVVLAAYAAGAAAQQYPNRNISMIVPYAAGGPTDTVARVLAQAMGKPMGQTVIVENRPSAGGILAPEQVALTMASPPRAPGAAAGAPISMPETGLMRSATFSGASASRLAVGCPVTNCTSMMMPTIGTTNERTTTTMSCCGVLMKDECSSWSLTAVGPGWR